MYGIFETTFIYVNIHIRKHSIHGSYGLWPIYLDVADFLAIPQHLSEGHELSISISIFGGYSPSCPFVRPTFGVIIPLLTGKGHLVAYVFLHANQI